AGKHSHPVWPDRTLQMSTNCSTHIDTQEDPFVSAARRLRARGCGITWLRPGEKRPQTPGWTTRSQEPEDYTPGSNLGVLTGWLSDDLVCVDLDSQEAIDRADEFLPPTDMIDGRPSKPRAHRWYRVRNVPPDMTSPAPQASAAAREAGKHPGPWKKPFNHAETGKRIIDFLGTGGHAVVPPSTHDSGEQRVWDADGEPAEVDCRDL